MPVKIGIPVPTSADLAYNRVCWPQYAAAFSFAGGTAVSLPLDLPSEALQKAVTLLDGFVLPGSPADVEPTLYGQTRRSGTAPADAAREGRDRALLAYAAQTGKPVLAICFGMQLLNVWRGGTLLQDLLPFPVNHSAGSQVAVAHTVLVERESLLAGLLSPTEAPSESGGYPRRLSVNSSHHQAVLVPGQGLSVVASSSEDDVIEAVEGRIGESAMLGVQWHPERSTTISAASRALFSWLIAEAEDRQTSTTLEGVVAGRR